MTNQSSATFSEYAAQLRDFIQRHASPGASGAGQSPDYEFNELALTLFALQFAHNAPYRQLCQARKIIPQTIQNWRDIPAMPTAGFKEFELTSLPMEQRTHVFHSSGTTEQRPSRHFHSRESLALYETSLRPWFAIHLLPANERLPIAPSFSPTGREGARRADEGDARVVQNALTAASYPQLLFLTPSPSEAPHSSLVHMFETLRRDFGSTASLFAGQVLADGAWNLDLNKTLATLREAIAANRPVLLLGTAFTFVHLLDHLRAANQRLELPPGSRVLETGGYKGRSRTLPKAELHELITEQLDIPAPQIVCEYGMSELSSQAYDCIAGAAPNGERRFHFPPWARAQIISPETGREASEGEIGLIRIFDLANVYSVMAIQTEDLGIRRGGSFELLGRAALSEPRGCSLQSI